MVRPIDVRGERPASGQPSGFAAELRSATWQAHGSAEAEGALSLLIDGRGDLELYRTLLTQLYFVYAALESTTEHMRADPVAAPFAAAELTRLPELAADLTALIGKDWATTAQALPETKRYVTRLEQLATGSSAEFVAHHYTRYLGDLSGGFAVGSAARQHLGLTEPAGRQFFIFDQITDHVAFKRQYRELLDNAPWTTAEQAQVVAETKRAYQLNTELQLAVVRASGNSKEPVE